MEAPSGLRSRNREDSLKIFKLDDEKQIRGGKVSVVSLRVWAFLLKLLSMNQKKSNQLLMLLCLGLAVVVVLVWKVFTIKSNYFDLRLTTTVTYQGLTSTVLWLYLRQAGKSPRSLNCFASDNKEVTEPHTASPPGIQSQHCQDPRLA